MAPSYFYSCCLSFLPLFLLDAGSFKAQKRKPQKDSTHGISREGIQREKETVQDLSELDALFENIPLSRQGRPHRRR